MTRAAAFFRDVEIAIEEHREELDRLDAVAGDGDHGATMVRVGPVCPVST